MKIKEISALTGLTERTIRFYEERSLIQPRTERRNGREYRDYSVSDAEQLMVIAGLRRLHFSVEEIREMQKYPGRIARIAEEARRSRRIDAADQQKAASILERADLSGIRDITELAHRLKEASEMLPLPQTDISPDFGRMDSESREEKQRAFEEYEARQKSRYETGKRLVYLTAGIYTVYGLLDLILNFSFGGIISFCVEIGLSIALCCGVRWVRWWLAIDRKKDRAEMNSAILFVITACVPAARTESLRAGAEMGPGRSPQYGEMSRSDKGEWPRAVPVPLTRFGITHQTW